MEEPHFSRMVIVGPGLIGGSIGLAARGLRLADRVVGVGHRRASLRRAREMGAIDQGVLAVEEAVPGADLVVLATAVGLIPAMADRAIPHMAPGALLTDVGSTKTWLAERIEPLLPGPGVAYVGAHPLAGSEQRGIEAARADLFQGSLCILTPGAHAEEHAVARVRALWQGLGASTRTMSTEAHDRALGQVSHLVHLAAACLVNAPDEAAVALGTKGFLDTTRVASGDPHLWRDICASNASVIAEALWSLSDELAGLAAAIEGGRLDEVEDALRRAKSRRDRLLRGR